MANRLPILTYAPAPPKAMSRKRMALLISTTATASLAIGGVIYVARPAPQSRVIAGKLAPAAPVYQVSPVPQPGATTRPIRFVLRPHGPWATPGAR